MQKLNLKKMNLTKRIFQLTALVALFSLASCSTDIEPYEGGIPPTNQNGNNNPSATSTFKADFDGQTFTANSTQAIVNSDYISITGTKSTGEFFQITIPAVAVGTYNMDSPTTAAMPFGLLYSTGSGNVPYLATDDQTGPFASFPNYVDTSEIVISSIDQVNKRIVGTFKFTGARFVGTSGTSIETKVFTNGVFNLPFTNDVPAPTGNSFTAKLNGTNFVPTNISGIKSSGMISLIGRRGNVENIGVVVQDNITAGTTVNFTSFSSDARGQYVLNSTPQGVFGGDGSVTITFHDPTAKRIKGTFNFEATSFFDPAVFDITEGTFDITYM